MPRILIIDYEPRSIKQLSDPLHALGHEVLVAKDGVVGLDVFKKEEPDLVLIEAMLPKRHGFEVCGEMKRTEHGRRTPVVIVTSVYKGRKYRSQALHQHGADEYLEKPIPPDRLTETVGRLLPDRPRGPVKPVAPSPAAVPVTTVTETPAASKAAAATEVSAPKTAPAATARESAASTDATEAEIINHLDEILGDPAGGSGSAG